MSDFGNFNQKMVEHYVDKLTTGMGDRIDEAMAELKQNLLDQIKYHRGDCWWDSDGSAELHRVWFDDLKAVGPFPTSATFTNGEIMLQTTIWDGDDRELRLDPATLVSTLARGMPADPAQRVAYAEAIAGLADRVLDLLGAPQ